MWEKQREPEGGRGWGEALSPWVKSPTTTKEEGMSKEQKQTGTEGGRQINRAGEGGEPHRHQTQELLGERDPPDGKGDLCFKLN